MTASQKGLTLLEVLVAGTFLLAIAFMGSKIMNSLSSKAEGETIRINLDADSKIVTNQISKSLRQVGGSSLRPWASVWVEDNCGARGPFPDCNGADRISFAQPSSVSECSVLSRDSANSWIFIEASSGCCLTAAHLNQAVIVHQGSFYDTLFIRAIDLGACRIDFEDFSQASGQQVLPPSDADWITATMVPVDIKTFFIDSAQNALMEVFDANNSASFDAGETKELFGDLVDFQIALGYDSNPADGRVRDSQDENDEWLFNINHVNDQFGSGGLSSAQPADLWAIRVEFLGARQNFNTPEANPSRALLNGPLRSFPNSSLIQSRETIYLRSAFSFSN